MYSKLFHKDVYFPKGAREAVIQFQKEIKGYVFSKHLQEHLDDSNKDRSHSYFEGILTKCLNSLSANPQEPFEIELSKDFHFFGQSGWFVTKYCVRIPYDSKKDIVVSIRPYYDVVNHCYDDSKNKIVTAWINAHDDNHYTLDPDKYCNKCEWELNN